MRRILTALCLAGWAFPLLAAGPCVTDEIAAKLEEQFRPSKVVENFNDEFSRTIPRNGRGLSPREQIKQHGPDMLFQWFYIAYNKISIPEDPKCYVMLLWQGSTFGMTYWRLLGSDDCEKFTLVQENEKPIYLEEKFWGVQTQDLDGDGIPEVLIRWGRSLKSLYIYRWKGAKSPEGPLELISPCHERELNEGQGCYSRLASNNGVDIEDLDGDGKAEIIVHANTRREEYEDESGRVQIRWRTEIPTQIYHLEAGKYQLYRELSEGETLVANALATFFPGTFSLDELSRPGEGDLRVFVSRPSGESVDDFDERSFGLSFSLGAGKVPVAFVRRWENKDYPDLSQGNYEFAGVPVSKQKVQKQGDWQVNPSRPAYPLDDDWELVFLGPYLELRVSRAAVFPLLKAKAEAEFAKDPEATKVWVEVPLRAKLKDRMPVALSAGAWVKRTGRSH
jgi:hypothetical protein